MHVTRDEGRTYFEWRHLANTIERMMRDVVTIAISPAAEILCPFHTGTFYFESQAKFREAKFAFYIAKENFESDLFRRRTIRTLDRLIFPRKKDFLKGISSVKGASRLG